MGEENKLENESFSKKIKSVLLSSSDRKSQLKQSIDKADKVVHYVLGGSLLVFVIYIIATIFI